MSDTVLLATGLGLLSIALGFLAFWYSVLEERVRMLEINDESTEEWLDELDQRTDAQRILESRQRGQHE